MELTGTPTLADVDGREPGKVQLLAAPLVEDMPKRGGMTHAYFEEEEGKRDPWLRAEGLKLSLEGDWPEHHWAIVGNWRARYLKWRRVQQGMGFLPEEAWSPEAYVDLYK